MNSLDLSFFRFPNCFSLNVLLRTCPNLKHLNLTCCVGVSSREVASLLSGPCGAGLESLTLTGFDMSVELLGVLTSNCPDLTNLIVKFPALPVNSVPALPPQLTQLQCGFAGYYHLPDLALACPRLEHLEVFMEVPCKGLFDSASLESLLTNCAHLRALVIRCTDLTAFNYFPIELLENSPLQLSLVPEQMWQVGPTTTSLLTSDEVVESYLL